MERDYTNGAPAFVTRMKLANCLLATILIAAAAQAAEPFNLTLPTGFGAFTSQTQTATAPDGKKTEVTTWVSKSPTGEAIVVSMSKMPGKVGDPAKLFASTRDALLKSVNGTLDSEEKLSTTPPSERLTFHNNNGAFLRSRLIAADDKFFQVLYVGHSTEQRDNPTIAAMFDTFAINAQ
jgi:hypothetical protein